LPLWFEQQTTVAATVLRDEGRSLSITISPPVGSDARGRYRQNQLRQGRGVSRASALEGVLLQSNFGATTTGNAAAVHAELRRRGADLPVYWTIADPSVPVPDGGIGVIRHSRQWYELLQSVKYLIDNMYQPEHHRKPDAQVIVETFHGYPFKQM